MSILDTLLSEKRIEYADRDIQFDLKIDENAHVLFSSVNPIEFKRMISNLINNAVDAINHHHGLIIISLSRTTDFAVINVSDNGCGIKKEILPKLFLTHNKDFSFG